MKNTVKKWLKRTILGIMILVLIGVTVSFFFEGSIRNSVKEKYPPPGKMVNIGSHNIHVRLIGQGDITVVMDAGAGELGSFAYLSIEKQVAQHAKVLLYDRSGCNWSEKSELKRTPENIAIELNQVIKQLDIKGPVILVGHSQGGLNMIKYASMFRDQVNGLVLIDAAHPDSYSEMPPDVKEVLINASGNIEVVRTLSRIGILRLTMPGNALQLPAPVKGINNDSIAKLLTSYFPQTMNNCIYPEHKDGVMNHGLTMTELGLGSLPIRIISATGAMYGPMGSPPGWNEELEKKQIIYWAKMQKGLLDLSSNSQMMLIREAGHFIQFTQPDTVINTILRLAEQINKSTLN